ncbi:MAG TPA: hypothetical protein VF719_00425 [Abditibacteriaceae bacterium]|jgi:hypothetical protein
MNYPLQISFKILAIAQQMTALDAGGKIAFYVKQKAFKLKEDITLFADEAQTQPLYHIKADRVIDFNARYNFTNPQGQAVGSVKRQGMKSLWKSHYDVLDGDAVVLSIHEENPWIKVLDRLVGEIPVVGMLSGYFLHPAFLVTRPDGTVIIRLQKQAALFEGRFSVEKRTEFLPNEEARALLGLVMMLLLERRKG